MKFIDRAQIHVKAGDGGPGALSFRREKYVPKGGPDGGDGGRGGAVIFEATKDMTTLLDFRYKRQYKAQRGLHGEGQRKHGKDGEDVILRVPMGTVIIDQDTGDLMCDLTEDQQRYVAVRGGIGGRGNYHFKTAVNQAPRRFDTGRPGEEKNLVLELKLLADVGLVGCPNAGKSTLISRISRAKSKAANYPFTTLTPVLGMIEDGYGDGFVMADIPGLIEGAHQGVGLGDQFLRHVERTKVLVFLIDISNYNLDPHKDLKSLLSELKAFNPDLLEKPKVLVLNKVDLPYEPEMIEILKQEMDCEALNISAATGHGTDELIALLWTMMNKGDYASSFE